MLDEEFHCSKPVRHTRKIVIYKLAKKTLSYLDLLLLFFQLRVRGQEFLPLKICISLIFVTLFELDLTRR